MKAKNFVILLLVLVALVALARWSGKKEATHEAAARAEVKERLLDPAKLNDIKRFTVTSGTQNVALAYSDGRWVVENLWKYPADFNKVAQNLRKISDVEGGEIMRGGTEHLDEFGLNPQATGDAGQVGALMKFEEATGHVFKTITVGTPRTAKSMTPMGGAPDSGYVRVDNGQVLLVSAYLGDIPRTADEWIDRSILQVPFANVSEASVKMTNGTSYVIKNAPGGMPTLEGLGANEQTRQDTARGVLSSLQSLSFVSVVDPALKDDVTGLDRPDIHAAKTKEGMVYTVKTGHASLANVGRFARISVSYEKPAPPTEAAPAPTVTTNKTGAVVTNTPPDPLAIYNARTGQDANMAEALNTKLSPWIYVLSEGDCQTMLQPRDLLVSNTAPIVVTNAIAAPATAP